MAEEPSQESLSMILVGDHLGQVKKVLWPSGQLSVLSGCATPSSSNPVVSIEALNSTGTQQLIANKNGELYVYDCIRDQTRAYKKKADDALVKALPRHVLQSDESQAEPVLLYDKRASLNSRTHTKLVKQKRQEIKNGKLCQRDTQLAYVGLDIPLKVMDLETRNVIFDAQPPDKNWLGIQPEVFVSGLDSVGPSGHLATCSKSDSVIRVYDVRARKSHTPAIQAKLDQEASNEHAEAARFLSVASTGEQGHALVVGSNVGQLLALDLRFHAKTLEGAKAKRKRMQPRAFKVLGGFKGSRGGSIKDVKVVPSVASSSAAAAGDEYDGEASPTGHKVISCCLDRYLRIHNFTRTSRQLDKHVYISTKPLCCSPILYCS